MMSTPLALLLLLFSLCCAVASSSDEDDRTDIHLLALIPWPSDSPIADWDAGPDLVAGARVALAEVNNSTVVLPDHRLVLTESGHEACGLPGGNFAIVNLVRYAINPFAEAPIAAVIGMFCSTSTKVISPLAGISGVDLLQLSASNSPDLLTYKDSYPHLWRFLESATVHADAVVAIMETFNWHQAAAVVDFEIPFHAGIGATFIRTLQESQDLRLLYQGNLLRLSNVEQIIEGILESRARVIFLSTTAPQAAKIYCQAFQHQMYWPNYVWILADYLAIDLKNEVEANGYCSEEDIERMIRGSLLTYVSLEPDDPSSTVLVSNFTYQDFKDKYELELDNVRQDYPNVTVNGEYLYAAMMYDQVWAFAKVVHDALPELESLNYSISSYGYGQSHITTILEKYLRRINFTGATGRINFDDNREVSNHIQIYQIGSDFTDVPVGVFDKRSGSRLVLNISDPPSDTVSTKTNLLPMSVAGIVLSVSVIMVILVTMNLVIVIVLRNRHEIKAVSPFMSILIFIGCYLECLASLLLTVQSMTDQIPANHFTIWCNVQASVGLLGIYLILATNLFKMARIFRIFNHFGKTSRLWNDRMLVVWVLLVCTVPSLIIIIWMLIDPLQYTAMETYHTEVIPVYVEVAIFCNCQYYIIWYGFLYCYVGVLIFGLIFFAVQTRKINRRDFKDTKKVNGFVFVVTLVLITLLLTEHVLIELNEYIYANVILCFLFLSVCFVCQVFLFMPKVFPATYKKARRYSFTNRDDTRKRKVSQVDSERSSSPHTFTRTIARYSRTSLFSQNSLTKMHT